MKRLALVAVFLTGAGLSALALEGCSGPSAPPGDAGFTPTATWGTGGSYGMGGSYGTGGSFGAGGAFGGGNQEREDGGGVQGDRRGDGGDQGGGGPPNRRRDAGLAPDAGEPGGGGPPNRRRDAGPAPDVAAMAICPAGAMSGETCMTGGTTCVVAAGDGGRGATCTCRERGGEGTWRCERP